MMAYPHMCRDGHQQIGHSDSEHEQCPLCRAFGALDAIWEIVHTPSSKTRHRTAQDHFHTDFDNIRKLIAVVRKPSLIP